MVMSSSDMDERRQKNKEKDERRGCGTVVAERSGKNWSG